jgi:NTP pyrophosphatase (non-canonical NTP hydrolase)
MNLKEISETHHKWLTDMGWVGKTTPLEQLALVASEVGEAVNECRGEKPTDNLQYELADIILRVLGICENQNIDIEKAILEKMAKNLARGNKGRVK